MRRLGRSVAVLGALVLLAGVASAHQIQSSRFEAPLPLEFLYVGAGAIVGLTAIVSARTVTDADETTTRRRWSVGRSRSRFRSVLEGVVRLAVLGVFVVVVIRGLFGDQVRAENLATTLVWPVWVDGLALLVALVGSPWRFLSPWRTLYLGLTRLEGDEIAVLGEYPERLGVWPGLLGFVALVGITENLTVVPFSPHDTAVLLIGYMAVMLLGGVAFGPAWFENADPLAVFYRLFARVAPLIVRRRSAGGYTLALRAPWTGCAKAVASRAAVWFVVTTVYTVSFDGFTSTATYQTLLLRMGRRLSLASGPTSILLYCLGLAGFLVSFAAVVALVGWLGDGAASRRSLACGFAPTVLPIAVAYEFAHYYPYVVTNLGLSGGLAWGLVTGTALRPQLLDWLSLPALWTTEIAFVVVGHVVAVVAAHAVSLDTYDDPKTAWRAHLPLVVLMVGYTALSLWIISQPVVL